MVRCGSAVGVDWVLCASAVCAMHMLWVFQNCAIAWPGRGPCLQNACGGFVPRPHSCAYESAMYGLCMCYVCAYVCAMVCHGVAMGMPWVCHGCAVGKPCVCDGGWAIGVLLICYGCAGFPLRICHVCAMHVRRNAIVCGMFALHDCHMGMPWGLLWVCHRHAMGGPLGRYSNMPSECYCGLPWVCHRCAAEKLRMCYGCAMDVLRMSTDVPRICYACAVYVADMCHICACASRGLPTCMPRVGHGYAMGVPSVCQMLSMDICHEMRACYGSDLLAMGAASAMRLQCSLKITFTFRGSL